LAVLRRSTLIALNGQTGLARILAGPLEGDIKALMDRALAGCNTQTPPASLQIQAA
jgi:hypothetical protein